MCTSACTRVCARVRSGAVALQSVHRFTPYLSVSQNCKFHAMFEVSEIKVSYRLKKLTDVKHFHFVARQNKSKLDGISGVASSLPQSLVISRRLVLFPWSGIQWCFHLREWRISRMKDFFFLGRPVCLHSTHEPDIQTLICSISKMGKEPHIYFLQTTSFLRSEPHCCSKRSVDSFQIKGPSMA